MFYYVYVLIDPTNDNKPFYVGKGNKERYKSHFKEAIAGMQTLDENNNEDCYIEDIGANELEFEIISVYDATRCIAIESDKSFLNKEVKFI